MDISKKILEKDSIKIKLSMLWLLTILNYIYADILTLMDPSALNDILSGAIGLTPLYMFLGAVMMEIPIMMIFLSLILKRTINRPANIVSGILKTLAVSGSLFVGEFSLYYLFFVLIEIAATVSIVIMAWRGWGRDKQGA
jgi:hypothetical protein